MLLRRELDIRSGKNAGHVTEDKAKVGAWVLLDCLDKPTSRGAQPEVGRHYAPRSDKSVARID
jgi:methionyl-tRNA formyltransferase